MYAESPGVRCDFFARDIPSRPSLKMIISTLSVSRRPGLGPEVPRKWSEICVGGRSKHPQYERSRVKNLHPKGLRCRVF